ncbi:MAG: carbamoyltransferase C-terminal domain-containing protein [Candidatus Aminicenantes bacterium]|jgi:carbamoyltransferase
MIVLGINGGLDLPFERRFDSQHDAAAVLVVDGRVVSAIEEERLNRIKHTNKAPVSAMRFVLKDFGIEIKDVDKIAVFGTEDHANHVLKSYYLHHPRLKDFFDIRASIHRIIYCAFGTDVDDSKIFFVNHHLAHAMSAFPLSGFDRSLVVTLDGTGDMLSGMILNGEPDRLEELDTLSEAISPGWYYVDVIMYLGFNETDEYKVMGLAPYGDPTKYRDIFKQFYELLPNGQYTINFDYIPILHHITQPRRKQEAFTRVHKDIAAALQESLEEIVFHVLRYYQRKYNHKNLCLAGGVAHNCTLNGKIQYSGMFENIFVQPAAHDAGCSLGAALYLYFKDNPRAQAVPLDHVYLGTDIGDNDSILLNLSAWKNVLHYEKVDNIAEKAAQLLADGAIIGWVQGRSEFGPRALGNRSIIADPRPPENKDIINDMVKKREAFRPFAPSVLEEYLDEYYQVPFNTKSFPYMTIVLQVKPEKRQLLGAVTHVDGTARLQTVSKKTNKKYWHLIDHFRKITGIPVILNTSFNNNVEPIVDSIEDAIVCFLTTKLHYLLVGDFLIRKQEFDYKNYLAMMPWLPAHVELKHLRKAVSMDEYIDVYEIGNNYYGVGNNYTGTLKVPISKELFSILKNINRNESLGHLMKSQGIVDEEKHKLLVEKILELWFLRLLRLKPGT